MLESLQLVRGAVSRERLLPVLSHFAFRDGRVCGFDGRTYISAPAPDIAFSLTVPARPFLTAYDAMCATEGGASGIKLTQQEGRLRVSKGRMRVTLPAGEADAFPFVTPDPAARKRLPAGFLEMLATLRPFIGDDASRPWSASVRLGGACAMATNNIAVAIAATPTKCPLLDCVLPVQAVDELLRINAAPTHVTVEPNAATFYLPGDAWLRTALLHDTWPDAVGAVKQVHAKAKLRAQPTGEWAEAVESIRPFCPDAKHEVAVMENGRIKTLDGEISAEVSGWAFEGQFSFHIEPLLAVLRIATHLDLTCFPRVPWRAAQHGIDGVLLGISNPTAVPAAKAAA